MKTFRKHFRTLSAILSLVLVCALLFSCGASKNGMTAENSSGSVKYESYDKIYSYSTSAPKEDLSFDLEYDESVSPDGVVNEVDPLASRKVIKTVNVISETKSFDVAVNSIEQQVNILGGYIQSSKIYGNSLSSKYTNRSASYTLRIPAENLNDFMNTVGDLVNITSERENVDDITDSYTDIEARLTALKVQEARLLELLSKASKLSDIIELENRLSDVRYTIESYEARLRNYDTLVAFSTVNIEISEVIDYTEPTVKDPTFSERIRKAFGESWESFADGCKNFAVMFVYALPTICIWAVIIAVGAVIVIIKIKQHRKRRKKEATDDNQTK